MSQENVEVVLELAAGPDVDLGSLLRDDAAWAAIVERGLLAPDFEAVGTVIGTEGPYVGADGLREFLLDWLAPWETYRSEIERTIDLGERVVALYKAFGKREGSAREVESRNTWIRTFRNGRVAQIIGYATPAEALESVGLAE